MSRILDGKLLSLTLLQELLSEISVIKARKGTDTSPKLAYIYMGSNESVLAYLGIKHRACEFLNISTESFHFEEGTSADSIIRTIHTLNKDPSVSGVLVQLPLSPNMPTQDIIDSIDIKKDIDGLHSINMGRMVLKGCDPVFFPCTPMGCIELLLRNNVIIQGKNAVIVGRGNLAGMPLVMMLQKYDATVTLCHKHTADLQAVCKMADILIVAIGQPHFVTEDFVKPGAVLIDIGINKYEDSIVGDIHPNAYDKASLYSPVPGGVGPMTVASLMKNIVKAWKISLD